MTTAILSRDDLHRLTPSVFASAPINGVSDRYAFLPTSEVIDIMEEQGFFPVKASQSNSRDADHRNYKRHMLRFRSSDHLTAALHEEVPEIVLINSHDKSAAYSLSAGLYRLVCQNGLTIASATLGSFSIRHSGSRDARNQIIDTTAEIVSRMPAVLETVNEWKGLILPRPRQIEFAESAAALKPNAAIRPAHLLTSRRREDDTDQEGNRSLWLTLNVCQEWLMAGGLTGRNTRGRQIRTRPVKAVAADAAINRRLWQLAESVSRN